MTRHFGFGLTGNVSLEQLLQRGLAGYAFELAPGGRLDAVRLFIAGGGILVVRSEVTSIVAGSWDEIGTLLFSQIPHAADSIPLVTLSDEWAEIAAVEVLRTEFDDTSADSGVAIVNRVGGEIIVAAGAFPYSVALVAPLFNREFQGEYSLNEYKRVPMEY
jgi:hypothetical protein